MPKDDTKLPFAFTPVPDELIDRMGVLGLEFQEFAFLVVVLRHWKKAKGWPKAWTFVGIEKTIAPAMGLNEKNARAWAEKLEAKGLIVRKRGAHRSITWDLSPLFEQLNLPGFSTGHRRPDTQPGTDARKQPGTRARKGRHFQPGTDARGLRSTPDSDLDSEGGHTGSGDDVRAQQVYQQRRNGKAAALRSSRPSKADVNTARQIEKLLTEIKDWDLTADLDHLRSAVRPFGSQGPKILCDLITQGKDSSTVRFLGRWVVSELSGQTRKARQARESAA